MTTKADEVHKVCFKVDSAYVAEIARNLLLEENPHCVRVLMTGIVDMTYDITYAVLRGEKTFKGINRFDVIDFTGPEAIKYRQALNRFRGGILRDRSLYYRPYGAVRSLCYDDARSALKILDMEAPMVFSEVDRMRARAFVKQRVLYYARSPKDPVFVLKVPDPEDKRPVDTWVLFERVDWFPEFLEASTNPQDAVNGYLLAGRHLIDCGPTQNRLESLKKEYADRHDRKNPKVKPSPKIKKYIKIDYDDEIQWMEDRKGKLFSLNEVDLGQEVNMPILASVEAEDSDKLDWHGTYLDRGEDDAVAGWITPEGRFYGCDYGQHRMLVELMFHAKMEHDIYEHGGYVKIWYGPKETPGVGNCRWICAKELTEAQKATLLRLGHSLSMWGDT